MIRGPAGLSYVLLAVAAAIVAPGAVAATADRFVPADPHFVVAKVSQTLPDESLRAHLERWRASPDAEEPVVALAGAFIEHARSRREPRYFGRAEALLAPKAHRPGAGADLRRLYAEALQFRHAFAPAEAILDELLRQQPQDADTRLRRGSLRLTRGDFVGARADCAQLALSPGRNHRGALAAAGIACLAESLAGSGQLAQARVLLGALAVDSPTLEPTVRAYLLATRAELSERAGDINAAIDDYRQASSLAPEDDAVRAALVDALVERGDVEAAAPLVVENPSLALLVRQAALAGAQRRSLMDRARTWLQLEADRGDAIHHREAAMLALAAGQPAEALIEARANFETQRELADVRVLARAAVAAGDENAQSQLARWLRATGYQDAVTSGILAGATRS